LLAVELGSANLVRAGESRATYIKALQAADINPDNIEELLSFARS